MDFWCRWRSSASLSSTPGSLYRDGERSCRRDCLPPSTIASKGSRGRAPTPRHTRESRPEQPVSWWSVAHLSQGRTESPPCNSFIATDSSEPVRHGHFVSFPHFPMIYQIKLQYGFIVDATNQADALNKAVKMIRENPSSHISSVFQASAPRKRKRSLLMRILKGA